MTIHCVKYWNEQQPTNKKKMLTKNVEDEKLICNNICSRKNLAGIIFVFRFETRE